MLSPETQMEIGSAAGSGGVLVLHGKERLAKRAAAVLIAALADRPLLTVDLDSVAAAVSGGANEAAAAAVEFALRDARITNAVPHISGWEQTMRGDSVPARLQQAILDFPHSLILSSDLPWQPSGVERVRGIVNLFFPAPIAARRRSMLEHYLETKKGDSRSASHQVSGEELTVIASQFMLTGEQLRDVVYSAADAALQAREPLRAEHLFAASRAQSSPALLNLAHKIEPRYDWDDLVLPADSVSVLREIVEMVRQRGLVLEEWGLGKSLVAGSGVATLFSGPPGTGKTMAASVLAKHLGLDLFKIDLSGVVSKYIGETEKNLERIFSEAEDSNAILFFDEADAIFGKRSDVSDAHDRHANIEVSYLLQRMESYRGVTVLATNLRGNLDEAFFRRLQFVVDLPFPEFEDRLRIWQSLFPKQVPAAPDIDLALLARRFRFAGGNIRNVLVSATYQAAANGHVLTMEHLFHGARREMQKMGRMIDERDMRLPEPQPVAAPVPADASNPPVAPARPRPTVRTSVTVRTTGAVQKQPSAQPTAQEQADEAASAQGDASGGPPVLADAPVRRLP
jgi:cell division septation protein DedD